MEREIVKEYLAGASSTELAKKYGEESSKNFVNGILASVVKEEIGEN